MPVLYRASFGYLARHPWQLLLALTGICIGVAVMVAVDLANESSRRAFLMSMDAVNGEATHQVVAGPAGIDERLYVRLRVEEGLRNIAPVVEGYVDAGDTTLHLLGIDMFAEREFRTYSLQGRSELEVVPDREQGTEPDSAEGLLRRMLTEPGIVLLARGTAASLGVEPGMPIELMAAGKVVTARVGALIGNEEDNDAGRRNLLIVEQHNAFPGGPPRHVHRDQDEWFYVVEGRYMLEVDGHPHLLGPGDSVMAPRGVPHTWALDGTEPGRIVIAFQPAGLMDELFDAACQLSGMASPEALRPLFEAHGMQVVGPPLR